MTASSAGVLTRTLGEPLVSSITQLPHKPLPNVCAAIPDFLDTYIRTALKSSIIHHHRYNGSSNRRGGPLVSVRRSRTNTKPIASTGTRRQPERPSIVHSSLYLPEPVYESLRKIAFEERLKIHDVVMEGVNTVLRRRGYPSIESLKAGKKR
jgi:hypothetical protein